jgi:hypothetical protein
LRGKLQCGLSDEAVRTEIEEYVFTDEIINNLYKTLLAIKNKGNVSKTGIWINGYYGSGKSHFLKYVHYCVYPQTREKAFERLVKAVKEHDPLTTTNSRSKSLVTPAEIKDLKQWYEHAEIEDILFNAQDVTRAKKDANTFTYIFYRRLIHTHNMYRMRWRGRIYTEWQHFVFRTATSLAAFLYICRKIIYHENKHSHPFDSCSANKLQSRCRKRHPSSEPQSFARGKAVAKFPLLSAREIHIDRAA